MYDSAGELTWDAEYDIYGNIRKLRCGSLKDCPFRFPGQYADDEIGLYYNRFRYYDPRMGGYVSQDPIGLNGNKMNIYSYVTRSTTRTDPFGLMDPFDIAFSQTSISDALREGPRAGETLESLIEEARSLGRLPDGLTLNVMELNGGRDIVTLNNRTLFIAQQAGLDNIHPTFTDNLNKLNKLLDGGMPLDLGEQPIVKPCKG
jgi:RHS repeat-associated protein